MAARARIEAVGKKEITYDRLNLRRETIRSASQSNGKVYTAIWDPSARQQDVNVFGQDVTDPEHPAGYVCQRVVQKHGISAFTYFESIGFAGRDGCKTEC